MAKVSCLLEPGHRALIGIPIGPEKDQIRFNGCKLYGPIMLPHLFANWKQIDSNLDYSRYDDKCFWCYHGLISERLDDVLKQIN